MAVQPKPERFALSLSPITGKIYAGRVRRISERVVEAVGTKRDVTSDFADCVIEWLKWHDGAVQFTDAAGKVQFVVTLTDENPE